MLAGNDELYDRALGAIRNVKNAPATSKLGRLRSRAKERLSKSRFVQVDEKDIAELRECSPASQQEDDANPEDTLPPDYAEAV